MTGGALDFGSRDWGLVALILLGVAAVALVWGYWRAPTSRWTLGLAFALKTLGLVALALSLLEPLLVGTRARRGANIFAIAADNSRSMSIHDAGSAASRGQQLQELLQSKSAWQERLAEDFEAQRFLFDSHLRSVEDFSTMALDGDRTALRATLSAIARRFHKLPLAGVVLFSDGNSTDAGDAPWDQLPPVYPVVVGQDEVAPDISVPRVSASQTNFESAPVVIRADVDASGFAGQALVARLFDEAGKEIQCQKVEWSEAGTPQAVRFQLRPEQPDVSFFRVSVATKDAEANARENSEKTPDGTERKADPAEASVPAAPTEATLVNNDRIVVVDRGGGPYRVLYVCGRRIGISPSCGGRSLKMTSSSWSAWCASPAKSPSSPLAISIRIPICSIRISTTSMPTRRSVTISRCSCGSARKMKTSFATAFRKRPTCCTATTRSFSTTSRPNSLAKIK
jgi:hypothetical protein